MCPQCIEPQNVVDRKGLDPPDFDQFRCVENTPAWGAPTAREKAVPRLRLLARSDRRPTTKQQLSGAGRHLGKAGLWLIRSDVEQEVHHVAVLDQIVAPL